MISNDLPVLDPMHRRAQQPRPVKLQLGGAMIDGRRSARHCCLAPLGVGIARAAASRHEISPC
jgi:hypothetical protein